MSIYALMIDGWDRLSTWGYDTGMHSFYAQLTRNGNSDAGGPDIWISPPTTPSILHPAHLAKAIADATGKDLNAVHAAMNKGLGAEDWHLRLPPVSEEILPDGPGVGDLPAYPGLGPYSLILVGWRSSVFGYSLDMESLWARLRPDTTVVSRWWARLRSKECNREIWISPRHGYPPLVKSEILSEAVAARTGKSYEDVRDAINDAVIRQGIPSDFWIP